MSPSHWWVLLLILAVPSAAAQVISYEAASLPEHNGWIRRNQMFPSERWLDDGCFVQFSEMIQYNSQWYSEQDFYDFQLASFDGAATFFVQWRMVTEGPSSAIPSGAPALFAAGGFGPVFYQCVIAEDRVRFLRDVLLPFVWTDLAPGVAHSYRLELSGATSYAFYIDGQLIDSGVPEGGYPTSDSFMTFGARAPGEPATTRWDYIRFGIIPQQNSGDFDSNGVVDQNDLYFFVDCLLGPDYDAAGPGCKWADMNSDGVANAFDIQLFTSAMMQG